MSDGVDSLSFGRLVVDVMAERQRQERLRASGKFSHSCATPGITDDACLRVLSEEVDEVLDEMDHADRLRRAVSRIARGMNDGQGNAADADVELSRRIRTELVQVMAVAAAWVERIDAKLAG